MNELEVRSSNQVAFHLTQKGRHEEALAVFRGVARLAPEDAYAHYGAAICLRETGRGLTALEFARRASDLDERPEYLVLRAELEILHGDNAVAQRILHHVKQSKESSLSGRAAILLQRWFG